MSLRWFLIAVFNMVGCAACLLMQLSIHDLSHPVSQALTLVLLALAALPLGWTVLVWPGLSAVAKFWILVLNAFLWAVAVEWGLRRGFDRPKDSQRK